MHQLRLGIESLVYLPSSCTLLGYHLAFDSDNFEVDSPMRKGILTTTSTGDCSALFDALAGFLEAMLATWHNAVWLFELL